jgi:hypothetical protein
MPSESVPDEHAAGESEEGHGEPGISYIGLKQGTRPCMSWTPGRKKWLRRS